MQLFSSLFERRRSTSISNSNNSEVNMNIKEKSARTLSTPSIFRSASLLKAKLSPRRQRTNSACTDEGRSPEAECSKRQLCPSPTPRPFSTALVELTKEDRPKRKSSLKQLLRHLRSGSREERGRTCDPEELGELAHLLELKEMESIGSVTAKRCPIVCRGAYRQSREVKIESWSSEMFMKQDSSLKGF